MYFFVVVFLLLVVLYEAPKGTCIQKIELVSCAHEKLSGACKKRTDAHESIWCAIETFGANKKVSGTFEKVSGGADEKQTSAYKKISASQ